MRLSMVLGVSMLGCVAAPGTVVADPVDDAADSFSAESGGARYSTVARAAGTSSCSTSSVRDLSFEIIEELNCEMPGIFTRIDHIQGIVLGANAFPYLESTTASALESAVASRPGSTMRITSTIRSLPQQYLLRNWFRTRKCGITQAAPVDRSNHQSGSAIDILDHDEWRTVLEAQGFVWFGIHDRPHFDFPEALGGDLRTESIRAFQRLWNRARPEDPIAVDGEFGAGTERRLAQSPPEGFGLSASCGNELVSH